MTEPWKTAFYARYGYEPGLDSASNSFRAGYLAQAETVERLRAALAKVTALTDDPNARVEDILLGLIHHRPECLQALADQPKET